MNENLTVLRICHLYARLLNIYGDRGNIITLSRRAAWRGMSVEIKTPGIGEAIDPTWADIYFIGGGQDKQQIAIAEDLQKQAQALKHATTDGAVILAVCGGYQLLGHYYKPREGPELKGISLIDAHTVAGNKRMIGNVVIELSDKSTLVGFENHSGKTFLGKDLTPLGKVLKGNGNNGEDGFEGAHYKNIYGTYLHGSLLPKNPQFADQLISQALVRRFGQIKLSSLDDNAEIVAHRLAFKPKSLDWKFRGKTALTAYKKYLNLALFGYAVFLILFIFGDVLILVDNALAGTLDFTKVNGVTHMADFVRTYAYGRLALSADRAHIYRSEVQIDWLNKLISPARARDSDVTEKPPLMFFAVMPMTGLPLSIAHLVWDSVLLAIGLLGLILLMRDCSNANLKMQLLVLLGTTASMPSMLALFSGQTSWFVLGMAALYFWALLKKKDLLAGLFLALSIDKFQYTVFWLVPALAQKRFKIVLTFLAGVMIMFITAGLWFGWQSVIDYPSAFLHMEKDLNINPYGMICIRGLLANVLPQHSFILSVGLSLVCLAVLFWFWCNVNEKNTNRSNLAICITIHSALLTAAHVFSLECILLAIPASLILPAWQFSQLKTNIPFRLYYLLLLTFPILSMAISTLAVMFGQHGPVYYAVLNLLFLICSSLVYRQQRQE